MNSTPSPVLLPLTEALKPYPGIRPRTIIRWYHAGKLPLTRAGRSYHVDPHDLAALLRPKLCATAAPAVRESSSERARRQLAKAGIR